MPQNSTGLRDALGTLHAPAEESPRIVSLVPSLTELLCDLNLADRLVGRSGFYIHPRTRAKSSSASPRWAAPRMPTSKGSAPPPPPTSS